MALATSFFPSRFPHDQDRFVGGRDAPIILNTCSMAGERPISSSSAVSSSRDGSVDSACTCATSVRCRQGAPDREQDFIEIERLGDVIVSPQLHGLDRGATPP